MIGVQVAVQDYRHNKTDGKNQRGPMSDKGETMIESVNAMTLATHDMERAVRFYRALGFDVIRGGATATFTSFRAGTGYLNLTAQPAHRQWSW